MSAAGAGRAEILPPAKSPVWRATRGGRTIWIFGGLHTLRAGDHWIPAPLVHAARHAEVIYLETLRERSLWKDVQAAGLMLAPWKGRPSQLLSAIDRARFEELIADLQLQKARLDTYKPVFAGQFLRSGYLARRGGFQAQRGQEAMMDLLAPGVRRVGLEDSLVATRGYATAAASAQVTWLSALLANLPGMLDLQDRIIRSWTMGDLATLEKFIGQDPEGLRILGVEREIVTHRQAAWAEVLDKASSRIATTLAVVGVAHVIGRSGLPSLLEGHGFEVQRI